MTDKNRFSLLGEMDTNENYPNIGPTGQIGTPGPGNGQKRTMNDRSQDASKDDRTTKHTKIDVMGLCVDAATDMDN
jgi:hypothetical protein